MASNWRYPLFLIPVPGGFASVFDNASDGSEQSLIAFTDSNAAILFIASFNLLSAPKAIKNDREFSWLLRGIKAPVTRVLIDANPVNPDSASGTLLPIEQILAELKPEYSPWDYPVFALGNDEGFISIDGSGEDGEFLSAIALFSSAENADTYLQQTRQKGELCEIKTQDEAKVFLRGISHVVNAVALDPKFKDEKHSAQFCFSIETLLDKYLTSEEPS